MTILAPGLHAVIAFVPDEDGDDEDRMVYPSNFADMENRSAAPVYAETLPAGAILIETDADYTGHSVDTPFGPLTASELYAVLPVDSAETNFLPNIQDAYNWIVLDIAVPTRVVADGTTITVGDVTFDVEDTESIDDCPGFRPACPVHTLDDVGFSIVDDDFTEVASLTASDPEYGALTFVFGAPRLDYDLQHVAIDDAQRASLKAMDTPVARALIQAWEARANPPHMCLKLRKGHTAVTARQGSLTDRRQSAPHYQDTCRMTDLLPLVAFTFNPYASRRKIEYNDDGTATLRATTRTGTGQDMPGPITVPEHMVEPVRECMWSCGEAVDGKAELIEGRLVMKLISHSALWTDMKGNWFDYETLEPVDKYGDPLRKAA